jgi:hypothetical protein
MNSEQVMIHVRFSPDGSVVEIGERPWAMTGQAWYNLLIEQPDAGYQALSGGRAVFRMPRDTVETLKLAAVN